MSRSRRPSKYTGSKCNCWLCEPSSTKRAVIQERVNARAAREPNGSMADIKHQVDMGFCDEGCPHCDWICDHHCGCSENVADYQSKPEFGIIAWAMRHARGLVSSADEALERRVADLVIDPIHRRPRRPSELIPVRAGQR